MRCTACVQVCLGVDVFLGGNLIIHKEHTFLANVGRLSWKCSPLGSMLLFVCLFVLGRREDCGRGSQPHFPHETYIALPYTHTCAHAHTHSASLVWRTHSPRLAKPLPASRRRIVFPEQTPLPALTQGSPLFWGEEVDDWSGPPPQPPQFF